ncbi:NAD-dependent epimerase/dehydratase family protein [Maribacter hydrothermalis]|uniref:NAD-dependent epimerase n=1 Tax=Maribacter hydrothermalis TaxID=1836467 RepID=A0A1B7Z3J6_9FLAO|nr:NAD-dependent epimerase/dehydratase family protein [Maribacter hydrothermalis]APQ17007.1 NAD-dependent epimerase [Maribacter hydrothermalis]OBR37268.1 NAD-dependent epimerase [Maribacter hydrothermalis]
MVLVTGGTGLVGSHLLLQLTQNNISVRALYRSAEKLEIVKKIFGYYTNDVTSLFNKIDWILGDILDIPSLETAFENISQVYHCAAFISFDPSDFKTLERINREGTANIVNLCIATAVKKLCHVSTIGTIGRTTTSEVSTEETEWSRQHTNPYAITKYLAEMEVWRGAQEQLQIVIVNPGVILGPGFWESGSGTFFKTASKGYSYYPPGGSGFIAVGDVIKIMIELMNTDIKSERFILVADNLTYKEILSEISIALGKKSPYLPLKIWQLHIGKLADHIRKMITGKTRTITNSTIHGLKHPTTFDNAKVKNALKFKFKSIEDEVNFSAKIFIEEHS